MTIIDSQLLIFRCFLGIKCQIGCCLVESGDFFRLMGMRSSVGQLALPFRPSNKRISILSFECNPQTQDGLQFIFD